MSPYSILFGVYGCFIAIPRLRSRTAVCSVAGPQTLGLMYRLGLGAFMGPVWCLLPPSPTPPPTCSDFLSASSGIISSQTAAVTVRCPQLACYCMSPHAAGWLLRSPQLACYCMSPHAAGWLLGSPQLACYCRYVSTCSWLVTLLVAAAAHQL